MAFSPMIRRAITKARTSRSSWCLGNGFVTHRTISNVNDDDSHHKTLGNGGGSGLSSYRSYSNSGSLGGVGLPSYMRASVFWEPNKPLTIEEFRMPHPKAGEVLIKTKGIFLMFQRWTCYFIFAFAFVLSCLDFPILH